MAFDNHKNLAISAVVTAPSPATSGTSVVVTTGQGTRFASPPFNATIAPANTTPDPSNSEIVRVTNISTDTLTIARAQEGSTARSVGAGDQIFAGVTVKTFTDIETAIPASFYAHIFGDGGDGSCTLDGTNTFTAFASKSGATYTMTADTNCINLSLTTSAVLIPNGFRIKLQGNLNIASGCVIGNASPTAGLANGTAGSVGNTGSIGNGQAGGAGNTGAGTTGSKGFSTSGAGGAGSTGAAGAAQTGLITSSTICKSALSNPFPVLTNTLNYGGLTARTFLGGSGGGGGSGDGTNKGGGGGAGGDNVVILCLGNIVNNGTITAIGAAGGTPTSGNCGGGGGGGGGFIGLYLRGALSGAGTTVVTGGAAGTGVGSGANGNAGSVGQVLTTVLE